MRILEGKKMASTNSWMAENADSLWAPTMVYALEQTSGRGQRGNSWESEPGKNLTASVCLDPGGLSAGRQFVISEAVALAVADFLLDLNVEPRIKWPNDIYVGDRKICGILIENSILGNVITRSIAGVGINLNQRVFRSDAPNPVSVVQLTGEEHDLYEMAQLLADKIECRMDSICDPEALHEEFLSKLWRGDGRFYPFHDRLMDERISASIADVASDGTLTLKTDMGETRKYMFKEIEFIL